MSNKGEEIQKTDDHDKFGKIIGNRPENPAHVKAIIRSIGEKNMLPSNPIVVNEHMDIVDGQHRLAAARQCNLPIYYIVQKGAGLKEAQLGNTAVRNWKVKDYLESHCELGKKDYQLMASFIDRYGFPVSVSAMMLSDSLGSRQRLMVDFRNGDFEVTSAKAAEKLAEAIMAVRETERIEGVTWKEQGFVVATAQVLKQIPLKRLLDKLNLAGITIKHQRKLPEYLRLYEEIVNYHQPEDKRVRLF